MRTAMTKQGDRDMKQAPLKKKKKYRVPVDEGISRQ